MKEKKQLVTRYVYSWNASTLEDIIRNVSIYTTDFSIVEWDEDWNGEETHFKYETLETDAEYAERLKKEAVARLQEQARLAKKEEKEREEYERLKAKFGDN